MIENSQVGKSKFQLAGEDVKALLKEEPKIRYN